MRDRPEHLPGPERLPLSCIQHICFVVKSGSTLHEMICFHDFEDRTTRNPKSTPYALDNEADKN